MRFSPRLTAHKMGVGVHESKVDYLLETGTAILQINTAASTEIS